MGPELGSAGVGSGCDVRLDWEKEGSRRRWHVETSKAIDATLALVIAVLALFAAQVLGVRLPRSSELLGPKSPVLHGVGGLLAEHACEPARSAIFASGAQPWAKPGRDASAVALPLQRGGGQSCSLRSSLPGIPREDPLEADP